MKKRTTLRKEPSPDLIKAVDKWLGKTPKGAYREPTLKDSDFNPFREPDRAMAGAPEDRMRPPGCLTRPLRLGPRRGPPRGP